MEIDILNIDKGIRDKWKMNDEKMCEIDKSIKEVEDLLLDKKLSIHVMKDLEEKLEELKNTKDQYNNFQNNLYFYIMDFKPVLE